MKKYSATHLIKSEDLNHHGTLFAARTASWFVESAFVAAACEHGDSKEIVCRNMHGMEFNMPMQNGDIARFTSQVAFTGKTSIVVYVTVASEMNHVDNIVEGYLTFVTADAVTGRPKAHGITLDAAADAKEQQIREGALKLR